MDNSIKEALEVIEILLDTFAQLPCSWEEMVSEEKRRKVVEFMVEYSDNDSWQDELNEMNGVYDESE